MKILKSLLFAVLLFVVFVQTGAAKPQKEITISAAISLKNAFEELGRLYEANNNVVKITFNFGASGDLVKQIEGGAPVDAFASAAQKDMDEAEKKGLIVSGSKVNFAENTIVLITPANTQGNSISQIKPFEYLKAGEVRKIAIGNPKTVPAGRGGCGSCLLN
ncbi:molybdate ABC transporter substrate-binding protein [Candidatus Magnetominusculus dajiuhuensis]|uniref:molybdate ABC transporter substrate-binding protein n=1 Tax=Candidatus Magnetominusculus dajiuhuensis TaxID=3137712 RepID=UPI003B4310F0